METSWYTSIGLFAGILTTCSFFPQVIKTIRSKHTKDLSLLMYVALTAGLTLWFLYGLLLRDIPLIFTNGISGTLSAVVLILKLKHG